jgi:hypothetical protein
LKRYIDDQWRDILAGQGFSPRTEEQAEVWRSPGVDALIQITHSDEGDPLWLFCVNRTLVEKGNDSDRLLYLVEEAYPARSGAPPVISVNAKRQARVILPR